MTTHSGRVAGWQERAGAERILVFCHCQCRQQNAFLAKNNNNNKNLFLASYYVF
jgi:hypothetical protein